MMSKKWLIKNRIDDDTFKKVCNKSDSMAEAASKLGLHFNSFKKRALELDCYQPNQAGIGIRKSAPKVPLEDIVHKNLHPHYQTFKLKKRLIDEGYKKNECEKCGISSWNGKEINCELHHINGKRSDHSFDNLKMLCPNCHSQTINYRAKNKRI
ncbi:MAG: hypothetical protein DHS20C13_25430 [Thermodesulfobacteriota bacterium]|nr:MAG: hypothetical protein DHS20C13_25430 [Thermodesulfobacteriota bacterium]GJM36350.1 MAG: hypothetical protein DHS20C18_53510 [Saprospiraceae bacterium]